jgi:rare lipoprotein A
MRRELASEATTLNRRFEMKIPVKPKFLALFFAMLTLLLMIGPASHARSGRTRRISAESEVHPGETLTGKATYYPSRLNGRKTSSGEVFRQNENTAASNKLPLGTDVKVTNLKNGKSADVTVTDHGAKLGNHKIDLSKKAANEIGLTRKEGTVPVKLKVTRTAEDSRAP